MCTSHLEHLSVWTRTIVGYKKYVYILVLGQYEQSVYIHPTKVSIVAIITIIIIASMMKMRLDDAEDDYDDIFVAFYKYVYTILPWTVWNDHRQADSTASSWTSTINYKITTDCNKSQINDCFFRFSR